MSQFPFSITAALALAATTSLPASESAVIFINLTEMAYVTNGVTQARAGLVPAFLVQLYYANGVVADENQLNSVTNAPVGFTPLPGVFNGGIRYLPDILPVGGVGTFQVRAWAEVLGASYEEALANWCALTPDDTRLLGRGNVFTTDTSSFPSEAPALLIGQRGFNVERRSQACALKPLQSRLLWAGPPLRTTFGSRTTS